MSSAPISRRPRLLLLCLMAAACLTLAHFVHEAWFARETGILAARAAGDTMAGQSPLYAPDAYRVAMPVVVPWVRHLFGFASLTSANALLDFCFGFGTLLLLWLMVTEGFEHENQRLLAGVALLALVQFPFAWVVPFQRPETMPTAFYVALALYASSRQKKDAMWSGVLVAATALQATMRTDVPLVFGVALAIVALRCAPSGRRAVSVLQGVLAAGVAGGVQWYLQTVRFPHLSYPPGTAMFQLLNNLRLHNLGAAALAVAPCLLPLLVVGRLRMLRAVDVLALVAAGMYAVLWLTVGIGDEVRIFVPFLLAICMVSARILAGFDVTSE